MTTIDLISTEPVQWAGLYQSTRLEKDGSKLAQKIFDAEVAMFKRKLQLSLKAKGKAEHAEVTAINEALAYLVVLRRDLKHWA